MNEELQKALAELLGKANEGIDAASGFLAAELPEVIQQLLIWHGVWSFILFFIAVILIPSSFMVVFKVLKGKDIEDHWANASSQYDPMSLNGLFSLISGVVGIMFGFACLNFKWLQIWIAPKVWLLEYAAKLAG